MANPVQSYFETSGDSPSALAGRIGRSASTITRALRGEREPSFEIAEEAAMASNGGFTAIQFIAACFEAAKANKAAAAAVESAPAADQPVI